MTDILYSQLFLNPFDKFGNSKSVDHFMHISLHQLVVIQFKKSTSFPISTSEIAIQGNYSKFSESKGGIIISQHSNNTAPRLTFNLRPMTRVNQTEYRDLTGARLCKKARSGSSLPASEAILRQPVGIN